MGVYAGRSTARQFLSVIHSAMLAEGYTEISSNIATDGRVYKSTEGGNNEFYIQIKDMNDNYFTVGFYEKYTPGTPGVAGTFGAGYTQVCVTWNRNSNTTNYQLAYILNINLSRVIIQCEGLKVDSGYCSSITYIGMPLRYDSNDKGPNFGGIAATGRMDSNQNTTTTGVWKPLRNRMLNQGIYYELDFYLPTKSFGWGHKIFYSPIFIGHDDEGPRGELSGLYIMEPGTNTEFQHYDTFKKDGKTYIILSTANDFNQTGYLPEAWYVMEVTEGLSYGLLFR
ncbi:hypothetical protein D3C76_722110 [compost metagenome]